MLWATLALAGAAHGGAVEVELDARFELVGVLAWLAEFDEFRTTPSDQPYLARLEAHFAGHADHPAVAALQRARKTRGVGYNAVSALGFMLDDAETPALRIPLSPWPVGVDDRWDGPHTEELVALLPAFVADTDFAGYRDATSAWRAEVERNVGALVAEEDPQSWFDQTFPDAPEGTLLVVPDPLSWRNNYAGRIEHAERTERYAVFGSLEWDERSNATSFGNQKSILVHEMAHSYAGPMQSEHWPALERVARKLFKRVRPQMEAQAYGSPDNMVNESLTRALTVMYLRARDGDAAAEEHIRYNERVSFAWVGDLEAALTRHLHDGVLDADAAVPDVVAVLYDWRRFQPEPTRPRSSSALTMNDVGSRRSSVVGVAAHDALAEYARTTAGMFWSGEVVGPDELDRAQILYGSPRSVPLIAELLEGAGITVAADRIEVPGHAVEGEHLTLAVALVHEGRKLAVYTSWLDEDIVGINAVFHGPTSGTIGRAGEAVEHFDLEEAVAGTDGRP